MNSNEQSKPFYSSPVFLGVTLVLLYIFYGLSQASAMEESGEEGSPENRIDNQRVEEKSSVSESARRNGLFNDGETADDEQGESFAKSVDELRTENRIRTDTDSNPGEGTSKEYFEEESMVEKINNYFRDEENEKAENEARESASENNKKNENDENDESDPGLRPELVPVCACESSYEGEWWGKPKQYDPDGSVRMSRLGTNDVGMCQINADYHGVSAKSLGYNIYTKTGNIQFANWLFDLKGYQPWYPSKNCWEEAPRVASRL